jgi:hypothetical protein
MTAAEGQSKDCHHDYETGSGSRYFHYDMLDQGARGGVRFRF